MAGSPVHHNTIYTFWLVTATAPLTAQCLTLSYPCSLWALTSALFELVDVHFSLAPMDVHGSSLQYQPQCCEGCASVQLQEVRALICHLELEPLY